VRRTDGYWSMFRLTMFSGDYSTSILDLSDVPRQRFLVAGHAWRACREGADPRSFGVAGTEMWGLIEVYGNLFQDLACLQKVELLPWAWYGLAKDEDGLMELDLLDKLAGISIDPDPESIEALLAITMSDPRIAVPNDAIQNALRADREPYKVHPVSP
jgi:hypothetical protein